MSIKNIFAPISLGELIDKITILDIKTHYLKGLALENVINERTALEETLDALDLQFEPALIQSLKKVNSDLWNIEDEIREKERMKDFGDDFIHLARSIYKLNDHRSAIKKEINITYGSTLIEEKAYKKY